jgi:S1-C subfamily serine protease
MKNKKSFPFIGPILLTLLAAPALGCALSFSAEPTPAPAGAPVAVVVNTPAPATGFFNQTALIDDQGRDFAERRVMDVYQQVSPAVVNVTTQVLRRGFFFEGFPEEGAGSGFVIGKEGHILTNFHVVSGAQQIEVIFMDETTRPATVVGADPRNDIAVLKVDAPPELLTPVELGTSANLQVGQRAIVIGNPFGQFGGTLTEGVISALNRTLQSQDRGEISGIIQTDAAINRGNSGGPLLDSAGKLIGMNTAIFSPSGDNVGVGFAVPVDTIRRVLPELLTLGRYRHPWLGIRYAYRLSPGLSNMLQLPTDHGLLLVELQRGGPLDAVGAVGAREEAIVGNQRMFVGGDILTAVNGQPIAGPEELQILLESNYKVGDSVTVTLLRQGQEMTMETALTEEPARQ